MTQAIGVSAELHREVPSTATRPAIDFDAFGRDIDALLERTRQSLGERDVHYIQQVIRWQRGFEVAGRGLLFLGLFPPAWIAGTACLGASKILENMEIGHNVMHGQYDFSRDPALASSTYEWDIVCPSDQWRHSHNYLHHTFTNVRGLDHDLGYRILRVDETQPWRPVHRFQPIYTLALGAFFQWGVAMHDVDMPRYVFRPSERTDEERAKVRAIGRKAWRLVLKDYVLFPLLAGPAALAVLSGDLVANLVRNLWSFAVIFCGHFPEATETFDPSVLEGESRGAFYYRQIRGSANFEGSWLMHLASGHLSHQIEHHMFPDIPAHRYPEMGRDVRAICEKHGVPYNTNSLWAQIKSVARRIFRLSSPPATETTGDRVVEVL